jgi:tetratricopeptide (TPR) repeat protein
MKFAINRNNKMESQAQIVKEEGNALFQAQQFDEAIQKYLDAAETGDNELKAICFGNISSCYVLKEMREEAVEFCDKALELKPDYQKVRERKIRLLLKLNKVKEAKDESEKGPISEGLKKELDDREKVWLEEQKEEMLGKLKDVGNGLLGMFGLSLDNFQTQKSESGGYSINFVK